MSKKSDKGTKADVSVSGPGHVGIMDNGSKAGPKPGDIVTPAEMQAWADAQPRHPLPPRTRLADLEMRVAELEAWCKTMKTQ